MTYLAYIVVFLLLASAWHLFWEGLAAPTLRMILRFKLFELRDELRELRLKRGRELGEDLFDIMDDGLNAQIQVAGHLHFSQMRALRRLFEEDEQLRAEAEEVGRLIEQCPLEEIRQIRADSAKVMFHTMTINSGGWLIYLAPIVLVASVWKVWLNVLEQVFFAKHTNSARDAIIGHPCGASA